MSRHLPAYRHASILRSLDEAGTVTVEDVARALGVSRETVRRDLKLLARDGRLTVVHGGALRRDRPEAPLPERRDANRDAKAAIAALAAHLVADGMTLLLDSGTTAEAAAEALVRAGRSGLTVHTTGLGIARILGRRPGIRVELIGGAYDPNDDATTGPEVRRAVTRLRADLAFVGAGGIAEDGAIGDFTRAAALTRGAMLGAAERAYVLADHSKFGVRLASAVPADGSLAGILTDRPPPVRIAEALHRRNLRLIVPSI